MHIGFNPAKTDRKDCSAIKLPLSFTLIKYPDGGSEDEKNIPNLVKFHIYLGFPANFCRRCNYYRG
ncbi:MAG: hypothetical protein JETT_0200 [Candidatus Jettenia ecosi]|uniref:Uncharacterized protein n=1 Tax=Candidatus Jettenia ecosi TaxID=2494326 RepID=A0A533QFY3_9BACT|nr:MAG: hypothetical protein JETT_0200 [Candidatus Jettenia ecosi]